MSVYLLFFLTIILTFTGTEHTRTCYKLSRTGDGARSGGMINLASRAYSTDSFIPEFLYEEIS